MPPSRRRRVDQAVMSLAAQDGAAGAGAADAEQRLDELGLPVALDPGDAEHLAAVDDEGDVVDERPGRPAPRTVRPSTRRTSSSVTVDSRVSGDGSSLPTMSSASWRAVVVRRVDGRDGRAARGAR